MDDSKSRETGKLFKPNTSVKTNLCGSGSSVHFVCTNFRKKNCTMMFTSNCTNSKAYVFENLYQIMGVVT